MYAAEDALEALNDPSLDFNNRQASLAISLQTAIHVGLELVVRHPELGLALFHDTVGHMEDGKGDMPLPVEIFWPAYLATQKPEEG